jgi:uncharacterized membrane protein (DUF2068 family)
MGIEEGGASRWGWSILEKHHAPWASARLLCINGAQREGRAFVHASCSTEGMAEHSGTRPLGHTLIAIGKGLKAALLLTVACVALVMAGKDPPAMLMHWADALRIDPGSHHLHHLVAKLSGATPAKLEAIGLGSFVYAALFLTEGVGLWLQKRWAEILTIVITISFIPLELYEIAHHASAEKLVTLVLNVAALVYLVVRVRQKRGREHEGDPRRAGLEPRPSEV